MFFSWLASILALGGLASLLLVEPKDFGIGFHRFIGSMASLLLAAGMAGGALGAASGWSALLSCTLWVFLVQWGPASWIRSTLAFPILCSCWALLEGTSYAPKAPLLELSAWVAPGNALAASLLMGSVSVAMLVGHWYLVIPGLPMRHLQRMTRFLGLCIALRLLLGALSLGSSHSVPALGGISGWQVAGGIAAFFFWQRVGIGLLAPAVLTLMVERTVRIGSTQSATGLLYVTMIFVLIGELISRYLYMTMGVPQ
ncbi:MAG: hypothetical protein L0Z52_09630 [Acidobacteria bacterium]|nr:hypothetical protein [Acidobacteriota bacterium]